MLRFKLILIVKKPLLKVVVHREKLTNTARKLPMQLHTLSQINFCIKNLKNIWKI